MEWRSFRVVARRKRDSKALRRMLGEWGRVSQRVSRREVVPPSRRRRSKLLRPWEKAEVRVGRVRVERIEEWRWWS